jgi:hypothetical protein
MNTAMAWLQQHLGSVGLPLEAVLIAPFLIMAAVALADVPRSALRRIAGTPDMPLTKLRQDRSGSAGVVTAILVGALLGGGSLALGMGAIDGGSILDAFGGLIR